LTWQRYNGARRSRFLVDEDAYEQEFGSVGGGWGREVQGRREEQPEREREVVKEREVMVLKEERRESGGRRERVKSDLWTEVTKDLVVKEAIEEMGYDYEENADFFYVIEYLRYVSLRLSSLSLSFLAPYPSLIT
ncbi:hypothetical protein LTR66_014286, partial [Elasticomyces elasticus]